MDESKKQEQAGTQPEIGASPEQSEQIDGLDPELVRLPPPRPPRSPVVALVVLVVSVVLLVHLKDDIRYARSHWQPIELDAQALPAGEQLPDNRLVAVRGLPDYRNALLYELRGDTYRHAFLRLLGTGNRLLVRADQTSTRQDISERFVGRLRTFASLSFADQVRDYYAHQEVTRFLDLASLRACFPQLAACASLKDGGGERLELDPARPLLWVVDFPDELKISLSRERFLVEEDARHELERLGQPLVGKAEESKTSYTYIVKVPPERRDAYLAKLDPLAASFAVHRERISLPLGAAAAAGEMVTLQGTSYPWSRIVSVQVESPVRIPADAWVILENERPGEFRWTLWVGVGLVLCVLFNLALLVRWGRARLAR